MSKTWYGHHIETIKGDDYVLFKDYLKLDKEIDRLNNIIEEIEKDLRKEIERTEELILEDGGLVEITNIRKMINDERRLLLLKINKLKELKENNNV